MPKISVVIPTYNRAKYLDQAIVSVLAQRGADFEIIVSDNCSQDDTTAVVSKYLADSRVHYYRNEQNIGMVRNWRKAVFDYASGDWFILLSDDDYLIDPDYLAKVTQLIAENPSLVLVYAEGYKLDENTGQRELITLPFEGVVKGVDVFLSRGTIKPQDFTLCNVVFNRRMSIGLDAFSNLDNICCDSELFLKLTLMGDVGVVNTPVSVYRFHSGNLIKTAKKSPNIIYGNLEHLVAPYLLAKGLITSEQLLVFRRNTKLDLYVNNSMLRLARYGWRNYRTCQRDIAGKIPEVTQPVVRTFQYRLKLYGACVRGWLELMILRLSRKLGKN